MCNLAQKASLESVLSAAFSLKHASNMTKSFKSKEEAKKCLGSKLPKNAEVDRHISLTPTNRYVVKLEGKLIKPPTYVQPDASALIEYAREEKGMSDLSCVIDQTKEGQLKAIPAGHTDLSHQTAFTFASVEVQAQEGCDSAPIASHLREEDLQRTIDSHLWLSNLSTSVNNASLPSPDVSHLNPLGISAKTGVELKGAHTQLELACRDANLTRMLKGVVTNMHCLLTLAVEAGFTP